MQGLYYSANWFRRGKKFTCHHQVPICHPFDFLPVRREVNHMEMLLIFAYNKHCGHVFAFWAGNFLQSTEKSNKYWGGGGCLILKGDIDSFTERMPFELVGLLPAPLECAVYGFKPFQNRQLIYLFSVRFKDQNVSLKDIKVINPTTLNQSWRHFRILNCEQR